MFKRLIDSYKKGIDLYYQLGLKICETANDTLNAKASTISMASNVNSTNTSSKYLDMYRLLMEKFGELENNFRNLLLIDGVSLNLYDISVINEIFVTTF